MKKKFVAMVVIAVILTVFIDISPADIGVVWNQCEAQIENDRITIRASTGMIIKEVPLNECFIRCIRDNEIRLCNNTGTMPTYYTFSTEQIKVITENCPKKTNCQY